MTRGFSLIEVMVVIGIAGLLAAIGFVVSIGAFQRYSFSSERDLVVSLLQTARSKAMANVNETTHGIRIDSDNFVIFEGPSGSPTSEQFVPRSSGVTITSSSGDDTVVFEQLSGDADSDETFSLLGQRASDSADIDVFTNGRISWSWN